MDETNDQDTSRRKPDSATTLTDLFIMLALERHRGTANAGEISELLEYFGIVISAETINATAKRKHPGKPFEKNEDGQISFVQRDGALHSHFLARALTAINARHSMMIPRRAFQSGGRFVQGTWTPSGFTARWLDEQEMEEEKAARAKPVQLGLASLRVPRLQDARQKGGRSRKRKERES